MSYASRLRTSFFITLLSMLVALAAQNTLAQVFISEIRIDQSGADTDEYFELAGTPGASLDGLTYLVIGDGSGGSGVIDPDFQQLDGTNNKLETDTINGTVVWWVDTAAGTDGNRDKTDMILYTRAGEPNVECASCHDPHAETEITGVQVNFLRMANTGSALCLACHVK